MSGLLDRLDQLAELERNLNAHSPWFKKGMTLRQAFESKFQTGDSCWEWQGHRPQRNGGYGSMVYGGERFRAHRLSWELTHGPIPAGMQVLHHCDNPPCVRPDHLFLGTDLDNRRDQAAKGRMDNGNKRKTHCPRGHAYDRFRGGKRYCRACQTLHQRNHRARKQASALAPFVETTE